MSEELERIKKAIKPKDIYEQVALDEDFEIIDKREKALNEILALHDKWLGNEMSDFEFFTLLNEARDKYGLLEEVHLCL